jgi:glycosyltransferase involved in cell wall biosynthesis
MINKNIPAVSVVLPVHNESGCIEKLLRDMIDVCRNVLHLAAEIIVVDDASDDNSAVIVEQIASELRGKFNIKNESIPNIRLIRHALRAGQAGTLMDGFLAAKGEIIVSMDADGQFDPREIPRLLERLQSCDIVFGIRQNRQDSIVRKIASKIANKMRNIITGDTLTDAGCTFRSMKKVCVAALEPFQGKLEGCEFFFHPLIIRKAGYRVEEIGVSHHPRVAGMSKYHLIRGRLGRGLIASLAVRRMLGRR